MSYRSFKAILGETKLELKTLLLFGVCLLTLIAASFYWYGSRTEQQVYEQNRWLGRGMVDSVIFNIHYSWLDRVNKREPNPDFAEQLSDFHAYLSPENFTSSILLPNASSGKGAPQDEFEVRVLEEFLKSRPAPDAEGNSSEYRYRRISDRQEFVYYQAVRAQDKCVGCHNALQPTSLTIGSFGASGEKRMLAKGDLIAVIKVAIPDIETQKALSWNNAILWATAIITVFLAIVASYLIIRYVIVKPLKHLRDVSDAVSHGNTNVRADIHTGDEFEELAVAYNRMLRHMIDAQSQLKDANGTLNTKVDELAQANMQLYEMSRLKSDFLATMSHELRTPLNSIIGFSDVLGSIASLDDKQKRYVQNIQKSGRVLLDMINDILDLAKIESGKMEVRLSEFRIDQLVHAQCDMARPLTERKNIDLDVDIDPGLPSLFQDQGKVQQVLNNLLSNAIKFTPEGGRIVVSAKVNEAGHLQLAVADTGIGIAEEDQIAIFEKFRQGASVLKHGDAMTREYSGTGLGLSIVKELCKLLGGEITVVSHLGQGSTFTVELPLSRSAAAPRLELPAGEGIEDTIRLRRNEPARAEAG